MKKTLILLLLIVSSKLTIQAQSQEHTKIENAKAWWIQNFHNDTTKLYNKKNRILHWDSAQVVKEGALELIKVPLSLLCGEETRFWRNKFEDANKDPNNPNKVQSEQYFYFRAFSISNYDALIIKPTMSPEP